jgi:hypothetical protein
MFQQLCNFRGRDFVDKMRFFMVIGDRYLRLRIIPSSQKRQSPIRPSFRLVRHITSVMAPVRRAWIRNFHISLVVVPFLQMSRLHRILVTRQNTNRWWDFRKTSSVLREMDFLRTVRHITSVMAPVRRAWIRNFHISLVVVPFLQMSRLHRILVTRQNTNRWWDFRKTSSVLREMDFLRTVGKLPLDSKKASLATDRFFADSARRHLCGDVVLVSFKKLWGHDTLTPYFDRYTVPTSAE